MKKQKSQSRKFMLTLFFSFMLIAVSAQDIQVNGNIKDVSGENLIGVSVKVKNSNKGTITSFDGNFDLKAKKNDVLLISYVGYVSQEVPVSGELIKIVLKENSVALEDVVVIGYGSVRKSDLTGSVSSIKTKDLTTIPTNSIESILQGRSAGLQVTNSSQNPDASSTIRLRGGSSLLGSNAPLIVVDGFPFGDAGNMKQINTDNIESVEILKDASASAIYGSRGSNGVILITTKKAKKGETTITIKNQLTASSFASTLIQHYDPLLMMQISNEGRINSGLQPYYTGTYSATGAYYPSLQEVESGAWPYFTDWASLVLRPLPLTNNTTFTLRSANEKTNYSLSGNFYTQEGVYIKDLFSKGIITLNIDHKVNDKLSITSSTNVNKNYRNDNTDLAYYRNPLWPVYNEKGEYYLAGNQDFSNPVAISETQLNRTEGIDIATSLMSNWQITKGLELHGQVNYRFRESENDRYYPKAYTQTGASNNGAAMCTITRTENLSADAFATYKIPLNKIHNLTVMGGIDYETYTSIPYNIQAYDFENETLQNENMAAGNKALNVINNTPYTHTKLLSYMFRTNYIFNDKYLATITARADGSSKFGANNKWGFFPSAALSWKLHYEDFIKKLGVFDEFKLRASYGILGNQGISAYQTLSRYGSDNYYVNGKWATAIGPGFIIGKYGADYRYTEWGGIPNKDLRWESTQQTNIGVDMAFFKRRLRATIDVYNKNTFDLLRQSYIPLSTSFDKMWINDGGINNRGIEVSIDGDIIAKKDFSLSGTFIYSVNKNKVVNLGSSVSSGLQKDFFGLQYEYFGSNSSAFRQDSPNILALGYPVNVFYGYKTDGIVQTKDEGLDAGLRDLYAEAGEIKYVDLSGDGVFNQDDRTVIGDPNPDFTASLSLNAQWKNWDASVFLNGVFGNDVLYSGLTNSAKYTPLRWTSDNPSDRFPRARDNREYYVADWLIQDGSFIRVQNVNLGYTVNNLVFFKTLRAYINMENLFNFTSFEGYDPEVEPNGRFGSAFPRLKKFTVGLELTF